MTRCYTENFAVSMDQQLSNDLLRIDKSITGIPDERSIENSFSFIDSF